MSSLNSETNNILITSAASAGQNYAMVKIFKEVLHNHGINAKVYTCDMEPDNAPACMLSDNYFAVPRITSEDYMQVLQSICIGNHVKLVIPTAEKELPILSANQDIFAKLGVFIFVSDYDFVMKCIDNHQFDGYLETLGIDISIPQHIGNYETLVDTVFTRPDFVENIVIILSSRRFR